MLLDSCGFTKNNLIYISWCALVLFCVSNIFASDASSPSVDMLRGRVESYYKNYRAFRGIWTVSYDNAVDILGAKQPPTTWEVNALGSKAKITVQKSDPPSPPPSYTKNIPPRELEFRKKYRARHYARKEFITSPEAGNLEVFSEQDVIGEINPTTEQAEHIIGRTPFAYCYGYFHFQPIETLLKEMALSAETKNIDGVQYDVLVGKKPDGNSEFYFYLLPDEPYSIHKIQVARKVVNPDGVPIEVAIVHDQLDFETHDGVAVPMRCEQKAISGSRTSISSFELKSIEFAPNFVDADFQLSIKVKDETRVTMRDAPHLPHMWQDGEIVPVVPEEIGGNKFIKSGKSTLRFVAVIAGVVLLALAGFLHFRKWQLRR